jgi:hypothetical protein
MPGFEVLIDSLYHLPDIPTCLLNIDDSSVIEIRVFDEREKVIVECHQYPVIVRGLRKMFSIRITESIFVASGIYCPATTTETICYRNPDTFVTVQGPHACAGSGDRNSST